MNKISLLLAFAIAALTGVAQNVEDSVIMGASYKNDVYYHLTDGTVKSVEMGNWDLAFDATQFGYTIRINSAKGALLYRYPKADATGWSGSADTIGIGNWKKLYDSDTSWSKSAFTQGASGANVGWGKYNTTTHHIIADSFYIFKTVNDEYKKLMIENLASGKYTLKHADLDGSNEKSGSLTKGDFSKRNFGYFSIKDNKTLDREPDHTKWDLLFTKYSTYLAHARTYYGVTGVLHNKGTEVAKVYPVADAENHDDYNSATYTTEINGIGYNWKKFGGTKYVLADSTCYFIKSASAGVYRIVFTKFEGGSTGKIVFKKEKLDGNVSIDNVTGQQNEFVVYPNPASTEVNLVFTTETESDLRIVNMTGKVVYQERTTTGFQNHQIDVNEFNAGIYFVSVSNGSQTQTQKLIVK